MTSLTASPSPALTPAPGTARDGRPTRIAVVSPSPLLARGLVAALSARPGWVAAEGPLSESADALVWHFAPPEAAEAAEAAHAGRSAPALADEPLLSRPTVLLCEGEASRSHPTLARALAEAEPAHALLSAAATPAQVAAALAAVLLGLSVRDAQWAAFMSSPAAAAAAASAHATPHDAEEHEPLTPRELEVYELIGKGLSNREIGGVLGISAHTAKFHVGQILAKVGAATRAEAVSAGLRIGLIGL